MNRLKENPWANKYLSDAQIAEVESSIASVEQQSDAEIVCMFVEASSARSHVFYSVFLLLALSFYALQIPQLWHEYWQNSWHWAGLWLAMFWPLVLILLFVMAKWIAKFHFVQRFFIKDSDELRAVELRAHWEFYNEKLNLSDHRNTLFIFISLMEHRVFVYADKNISRNMQNQDWDKILEFCIHGMKNNKMATELVKAIEYAGSVLAKHFPPSQKDKKQISNRFIIKS